MRLRRRKISSKWIVDLGFAQHEVAPGLFRLLAAQKLILPSSKNPRRARVHPDYFAVLTEDRQIRFCRRTVARDPFAIPSQFQRILELAKYRVRFIGDHEWLWEIQAQVEGLK